MLAQLGENPAPQAQQENVEAEEVEIPHQTRREEMREGDPGLLPPGDHKGATPPQTHQTLTLVGTPMTQVRPVVNQGQTETTSSPGTPRSGNYNAH